MADAKTGKTTRGGKSTSRRRNRPSPRDRLLSSATELFTTEGIRVIGIDRVLREADVAKASLYSLFGSKDKLVIAYLQDLDQKWRTAWTMRADVLDTPEEKILAFFDQCIAEQPVMDFRGSHFQNAASEYPNPANESEEEIRAAVADHRGWVWDTLRELLAAKQCNQASLHANMLMIFLDGGLAGAKLAKDLTPLQTARDLARDLVYGDA
ncbi:TetR/AcrR family transcriptional regulator [uncultured Corynebacterium sp.]|uniref:TetR/AcrR family transcriptional regulator n=1 Tax=uncultured Corynebacterium sp. TaxID=159447 RepID=UPI0025E60591|nr:TetR/AcrR family transcriptional regulator [uncultured Corynebacterium sp.]